MHFPLLFYFVVTTLCPKSSSTLVSSWNIARQNSSTSPELATPQPLHRPVISRGPVISPKLIWRYLGFLFDHKLNFHYHTHYYMTKCLSTLSAMKILENSSQGLFPIQKQLLYRICILPIALYRFQLWFFKGIPIIRNMTELTKIQQRAALWITGAF